MNKLSIATEEMRITVVREIVEDETGETAAIQWLIFVDEVFLCATWSERQALDIARSLIGGQ